MGLRQEAEELAVGLEFNFDDVEDAVDWADANIAALASPPHALLEISMMGKSCRQDVVNLLRSLPGQADGSRACDDLLARMISAWMQKDDKAGRIDNALYAMHKAGLLNAAVAEAYARLEYASRLVDAGLSDDLDAAVHDTGELLRLASIRPSQHVGDLGRKRKMRKRGLGKKTASDPEVTMGTYSKLQFRIQLQPTLPRELARRLRLEGVLSSDDDTLPMANMGLYPGCGFLEVGQTDSSGNRELIYSMSAKLIEPQLELLAEVSPWIASQGFIGHVLQEGCRWPSLLFHRRGEGVKRYWLKKDLARSILDSPVCTPWTLDWPVLRELLLGLKLADAVALAEYREWYNEPDPNRPPAYFFEGLAQALPAFRASAALAQQDLLARLQRLVFFAEGFDQSCLLSSLDPAFVEMLAALDPARPAAEPELPGWLCFAARLSESSIGSDMVLELLSQVRAGQTSLPPLQMRRLDVLGPSLAGLRKVLVGGTAGPSSPARIQLGKEKDWRPSDPLALAIDRQIACAPSEVKRFFTWLAPYLRDTKYGEVDMRFVGTFLADGADLPGLIFAGASGDLSWVAPTWQQLDSEVQIDDED